MYLAQVLLGTFRTCLKAKIILKEPGLESFVDEKRLLELKPNFCFGTVMSLCEITKPAKTYRGEQACLPVFLLQPNC